MEQQINLDGMLDRLASRIAQLEKEKTILIAQKEQLQAQLDKQDGTESE